MNGSSSNTNGKDVGNVGFWQRGFLGKTVDFLNATAATLTRVLTGSLTVAAVDFSPTAGTDGIADSVMDEIARRLIVTLEAQTDGNVVFSVDPPDDKSKVWWQIDPVTSVPIGQPKLWNADEAAWVPISDSNQPYVPPLTRTGSLFAPEGNSTSNLDFSDIGTTDYQVTLTPTTFSNGSWGVAPTTFPTHFGWIVANKATNQITVSFYGTPAGGITFEVDILERIPA